MHATTTTSARGRDSTDRQETWAAGRGAYCGEQPRTPQADSQRLPRHGRGRGGTPRNTRGVLAEPIPDLLKEVQLFLWSEVIEISGRSSHAAILSWSSALPTPRPRRSRTCVHVRPQPGGA